MIQSEPGIEMVSRDQGALAGVLVMLALILLFWWALREKR